MSNTKLIAVILGGAAAAAAIGYLFASESGQKVRNELTDSISEICNKLFSKATRLADAALENAISADKK